MDGGHVLPNRPHSIEQHVQSGNRSIDNTYTCTSSLLPSRQSWPILVFVYEGLVVWCQVVLSCLLLDLLLGVVISHVCQYSCQLNRHWNATKSLVSTRIYQWRVSVQPCILKKGKEAKKQQQKLLETEYEWTAGVQLQKKRNRVVLITIEISIESNYMWNRERRDNSTPLLGLSHHALACLSILHPW